MESFEIEYNGEKLVMKVISEGAQKTYMTTFASGDILFIKRAKNFPGDYFWSSIKEQDGEIAHDIIKLIDQHLKPKK